MKVRIRMSKEYRRALRTMVRRADLVRACIDALLQTTTEDRKVWEARP